MHPQYTYPYSYPPPGEPPAVGQTIATAAIKLPTKQLSEFKLSIRLISNQPRISDRILDIHATRYDCHIRERRAVSDTPVKTYHIPFERLHNYVDSILTTIALDESKTWGGIELSSNLVPTLYVSQENLLSKRVPIIVNVVEPHMMLLVPNT